MTTASETDTPKTKNLFLWNFARLAVVGFLILSLGGGVLLGAMHNDNRPTLGWGYIEQSIQFFFGGGSLLTSLVIVLVIVLAAKFGARFVKSGTSNIIIGILGLAVALLVVDRIWPNTLGSTFTGAIPFIVTIGALALGTLLFTPRKNRH